MARHKKRTAQESRPARSRAPAYRDYAPVELSLEEILCEFRAVPAAEDGTESAPTEAVSTVPRSDREQRREPRTDGEVFPAFSASIRLRETAREKQEYASAEETAGKSFSIPTNTEESAAENNVPEEIAADGELPDMLFSEDEPNTGNVLGVREYESFFTSSDRTLETDSCFKDSGRTEEPSDAEETEADGGETAAASLDAPADISMEAGCEAPADPGETLPEETETDGLPSDESAEGFEERDDLYAAPLPENGEEPPTEEEEKWPDEELPRGKIRPTGGSGGPLRRLYGRIIATLAVTSYRRAFDRGMREPETEDAEREMEAKKAARHYAAQVPALKRRSKAAFFVSLLPLWIAIGYSTGFALPGAIAGDILTASLVSGVAMLTVMLLALDVVTNGILSLFRGRPGAETLVAFACLGSIADCLSVILLKEPPETLPPCALVCFTLWISLRGSLNSARAFRAGFLALSRAGEPYSVTCEKLLNRKDLFLIKSRQKLQGFIRRSEEPDCPERFAAAAAPFLLIMALILSLLLGATGGDLTAVPHNAALTLAVCAPWCMLGLYPEIYARTAQTLMRTGSAVSGWLGVKDVGSAKHLILTDSDLFPEHTVSVSGVRILEGAFTNQVVAYTGSVLSAVGTELAPLFTEMMKRSGGTLCTVENFTVGEGGASAVIEGRDVLVGRAGYMYLHGVRIPPRLVSADAVYTAFNGSLVGFFSLNYTPSPSISDALRTLHRNKAKPIFAARDFNVDPEMVKTKFRCEVDGFEFPVAAERRSIADVPASGKNPPAAFVTGGGLARLADLASRGRHLFRCGRLCGFMTMLCPVIGMAAVFVLNVLGLSAMITPIRLVLYMLIWMLPGILMLPKTY